MGLTSLPTGPRRPWVMGQEWQDLLFMHWPVAMDRLRPLVPAGLEIDTFDGNAWIGIIPFRITGNHLRRMPPFPAVSGFIELNVRTYVTLNGKPGVYFFSLDANSLFNVLVARNWYRLNYQYARMALEHEGEAVLFRSRRAWGGSAVEFGAVYQPIYPPAQSPPGSIEHFLTERYCLYTADGQGRIFRGDIAHEPWPLQPAEAEVSVNSMTGPLGLSLPDTPPLLHFSKRLVVRIWRLVRADFGLNCLKDADFIPA